MFWSFSRAVVFLFLVSKGGAVTLRHGVNAEIGRDLAARIDFAEVVEVEVGATGSGSSGSGVFLNEGWVLTAAHLVQSASAGEVSIRSGGVIREVSEVHVHPGWPVNGVTGVAQSRDLVLLKLASPLVSAPTIPLWQGGESESLLGMMAGFGRGGNGLLGAYLPADGLQAGLNLVDRQPGDDGGFWITDFDNGQSRNNTLNFETVDLRNFDPGGSSPTISEAVFPGQAGVSEAGFQNLAGVDDFFPGLGNVFPEATTARGDSGGPLFLFSEERARWELAGVTSFGVNPLYSSSFTRFDSRYGDLSFFADVTSQEEWLEGVMIPELSQVSFLVSGLFLVWKRRRLKKTGF